MKDNLITELVSFQVLDGITDEQLLAGADVLNDFQQQQDGFIDVELVKSEKGNDWRLIYHFENMEKVMAIGAKLRSSQAFGEFTRMVRPGSLQVAFFSQMKCW